jgi:hypothetical protein
MLCVAIQNAIDTITRIRIATELAIFCDKPKPFSFWILLILLSVGRSHYGRSLDEQEKRELRRELRKLI